MNMITDTALLKHHRVDYSARKDVNGAAHSNPGRGAVALLMIATLALGLAYNISA